MATGIQRPRTLSTDVVLAVLVVSVIVAIGPPVQAAETPRRGGILLAAIGADAPSLDPHQESTFATLQPVAPLYSTLLQIDPYSYRPGRVDDQDRHVEIARQLANEDHLHGELGHHAQGTRIR
jgi:ABC-type oligopeptide transport system substrate-binding subunit